MPKYPATKKTNLSVQNRIARVVQRAKNSAQQAKKASGQTSQEECLNKTKEKAYELYQKRGYVPGYEQFDWAVAEEFVKLESQVLGRKANGKSKKISDQELYKKIEQKAYELSEKQGFASGNEVFNWSIAEDLIKLEWGKK